MEKPIFLHVIIISFFSARSPFLKRFFANPETCKGTYMDVPTDSYSTDLVLNWINNNNATDIIDFLSGDVYFSFGLLELSLYYNIPDLTTVIAKAVMENNRYEEHRVEPEKWWGLYLLLKEDMISLEIAATLKSFAANALSM